MLTIKVKNNKIMRDINIIKTQTGELNLGTRTVKDKSKYNRKRKHKSKDYSCKYSVIK